MEPRVNGLKSRAVDLAPDSKLTHYQDFRRNLPALAERQSTDSSQFPDVKTPLISGSKLTGIWGAWLS
jgi:hypothetical protein